VNGVDAAECVWKWQVGFRYSDIGWPFCGGTIINDEWVLSAAHCGDRADFKVVAGEWKPRERSGTEQHRQAVQFIKHPLYLSNPTNMHTHDYAMVRLDRAFDFNSCVGPACLPEGDDVPVGSECYITGWGRLTGSNPRQPDILQEAKVTVLANNNCGNYADGMIDESMLCAQGKLDNGGIVDACRGDSGGPFVCEANGVWTLHGATSWGRGCAAANYPGVWARVHFVMDWINQVMVENTGPPPTQPPRICPDFANRPTPDSDGDCQCAGSLKCSTNGGASINCPTASGVPGAFGGQWFLAGCEECMCYHI